MTETKKFVRTGEATKQLGIHYLTLHKWSDEGLIETIRTPNGYRLYNINSFINKSSKNSTENAVKNIVDNEASIQQNICYCRVSTNGQKDDLARQVEYMKEKYPNHRIIKDIGSGINFKRKGLLEIIDLAITGKLNEIVIAYKDRLCRFGYELIEYIVKKYSNGKITVLNKIENSPQEEIVKDLVQIINVFSVRINGLRKYKKDIKNIK